MKNYEKLSYLMYLDANNLYEWAMSQRLSVNDFKWMGQLSEFDERFIKDYEENNNKGYIPEVDVECLRRDLPFLPERKKIEKCNELVCNIHNKGNYVTLFFFFL